MKRVILGRDFFDRPVLLVARELIGARLVRRMPDGIETVRIITEVEAYDGTGDLACHASRGRTPRTEVMFGPAGRWYVYFVYGMHWMLNVVTGPEGYPAAVLIRGTDEVSGPARLTRRLGIDRAMNGMEASRPSGLWIEPSEHRIPAGRIQRTARIGVDYAGPTWAAKPWRFLLRPATAKNRGVTSGAKKV